MEEEKIEYSDGAAIQSEAVEVSKSGCLCNCSLLGASLETQKNMSTTELIEKLNATVDWDFDGGARRHQSGTMLRKTRLGKPKPLFWPLWNSEKTRLLPEGYRVRNAPVYGWVVEHVTRTKVQRVGTISMPTLKLKIYEKYKN